jgi:hypothetical protein
VRLNELYSQHQQDVEFIVVYVKEAHPTDKWWLGRSRTQRLMHRLMGIANEVALAYTARPTRIYLIGRDGRVVYNPGIGPFGFSPDHLEPAIKRYLAEG